MFHVKHFVIVRRLLRLWAAKRARGIKERWCWSNKNDGVIYVIRMHWSCKRMEAGADGVRSVKGMVCELQRRMVLELQKRWCWNCKEDGVRSAKKTVFRCL